MRNVLRRVCVIVPASFLVFGSARPVCAQEGFPGEKTRNEWKNDVRVYMWAINQDVDLTVGAIQVPLDASFGDLWDIMKFSASAHYEGSKGAWGLLLDGSYTNLGEDGITVIENPLGDQALLTADYRWKIYEGEAAVLWSPLDLGSQWLDFLAGARITWQDLTITFATPLPLDPAERGFDESWVDPILGVRWGIGFGDRHRWLVWIRSDVGGFGVSSDLAFNAEANLGFRISRLFYVTVGGRFMYTDYATGTVGTESYFAYKGDMAGIVVGFGFRF